MKIDKNILWDYADGLLQEESSEKVRQQLLKSDTLRNDYEQILRQKQQFSSLDLIAPEPNFAAKIMIKWQQEKQHTVTFKQNDYSIWWISSLLVVGLLTIIVTLLPDSDNKSDFTLFPHLSFSPHNSLFINILGFIFAVTLVFFIEKCYWHWKWKQSIN
jgi:hypothetical protein